MGKIIVFITVANLKEGKKIANTIVHEKLAACANIIPKMYSIYWWQGKVKSKSEVFIMFKTKKILTKKLIARVKQLHSYQVPEIIAFPIAAGNEEYLKWIEDSTC